MVVAKRDPRVQISPDYLSQRRTQRRPQNPFNLRLRPYALQPFLLHPVIPGETLTNIMMQAQLWSDPLKPSLRNIGWWWQYNFFYVRHRDLPPEVRQVLAENMLDPDKDFAALETTTARQRLYTFAGAVDWAMMCLQHVTSEFFRDEGEDWDVSLIDGLPAVRIYGAGTSDPFERLTLETDYEDRRVDAVDAGGHVYMDELQQRWAHWQALREAGLTEMDYEDFMRTFGSNVREDEESPNLHRAEDVWMNREFTYPTNTVEPTTGVPAVGVGWRHSKSGGKRIFADEPGFIFGVMNCRPKVYLRKQTGSVAGLMKDVHSWLPAMLHGRDDLGHIFSEETEGPVPNTFAEGYWVDIRDLLVHGDQFLNYDPTGTEPFLSLPAADGQRRYAAESEIAQFFTGENPAAKFDVDGLCSLTIQSRQTTSTRSSLTLGKG